MTDIRLVDGLNDAIRQNPLAASLVGAGVFWMLFGNKVPSLAAAAPAAARSVGETLTSAGQKIIDATVETASDVAQRAGDAVRQAGEATRDGVARATPNTERVEAIKEAGADTLRSSAAAGQRVFSDAQQRLSESLERQPLLLGAIGIAIGAGLASAFPATNLEKDAFGAQASAARERIEGLATEAKGFAFERGRAVIDEVQREAQAQGFTPEAAKQGLQDVAAKVKSVAGSVGGRPS